MFKRSELIKKIAKVSNKIVASKDADNTKLLKAKKKDLVKKFKKLRKRIKKNIKNKWKVRNGTI